MTLVQCRGEAWREQGPPLPLPEGTQLGQDPRPPPRTLQTPHGPARLEWGHFTESRSVTRPSPRSPAPPEGPPGLLLSQNRGGQRDLGAPGNAHFPGILSQKQALSSSEVRVRVRKAQKAVGTASCMCRAGEGGGDRA